MLTIEVNNLTRTRVPLSGMRAIAKKVLMGENREKATVSIACVGTTRMRQLNKQYRKKDHPTDVLAFAGDFGAVGEVVLCPVIIQENARRNDVSFQQELTLVLIHGLLHLLGYDHETSEKRAKKMEQKQEQYLRIVTE